MSGMGGKVILLEAVRLSCDEVVLPSGSDKSSKRLDAGQFALGSDACIIMID